MYVAFMVMYVGVFVLYYCVFEYLNDGFFPFPLTALLESFRELKITRTWERGKMLYRVLIVWAL